VRQAGLYRLKPASQRLVRPLEDLLVARRVSPDAITAASLAVGLAGGLCLAISDEAPAVLLVVPLLAAARLILNLLDGQVARRSGMARPTGEMWNELADRFGDVVFLGGLSFTAAVDPRLALGAVIAALLASHVGVTARAAGGSRPYGGIMSKPGRMIVVAVGAPLAFLTGDGRWLAAVAAIVLVGGLLTLLARWRASVRELGGHAS
jgi:CDP-diacylglycerol---glycerol-3-phosphate 3-phosphatidyltransferase